MQQFFDILKNLTPGPTSEQGLNTLESPFMVKFDSVRSSKPNSKPVVNRKSKPQYYEINIIEEKTLQILTRSMTILCSPN